MEDDPVKRMGLIAIAALAAAVLSTPSQAFAAPASAARAPFFFTDSARRYASVESDVRRADADTGADPAAESGAGADEISPTPTPAPAITATPAATPAAAPATTPAPSPTPAAAEDETPPHFREKPKYLPPLFIVDHDEVRQSDFFMLMMLYWSDSNPDRSYHLLVPFFYERHNKHSQGTTVASPFFYFYKSPRSKALYVPPVYVERGKEVSRTGIPPLFWYGKIGSGDQAETTSYLFPLYFYDERQGHRVLATPLGGGWGTRNDFQGLVGLYYWRNTHLHGAEAGDYGDVDLDEHVFFPLFWHVRYGVTNTLVAGPVFSQSEALPDGRRRRAFGVFPLFYERRAPGGGRTVVTPLSVFERRDPEHSFLITPVGGTLRSPERSLTVLGPWIDDLNRNDESHLRALFPVYFHANGLLDQGRERYSWTVLGPYVERRRGRTGEAKDDEVGRGVLPLFWYSRAGREVSFISPGVIFHSRPDRFRGLFGPFYRSYGHGRETWVLFPGIWHHSGPTVANSFGVLPFYYVHRKPFEAPTYDEHGNATGPRLVPGATYAGLFPLFFYGNKFQSWDGKRVRYVTLVPLFWYSERPGALTFLSPLYTQIRRPHDTRIMAAWLWWDHRTDNSRNLTFLPFFHWERFDDQRELLTPVGGYVAGKGYSAALWGPYYRRRDDATGIRNTVLFPVWWDFRSPEGRTFVVPPYFQLKQGAYFQEGFVPFYWHTSFPGAEQTIVFPLFLARHDKVERTRTFFTPLGGLWTREDPKAWKLLAPLVYRAEGPSQHTTVIFPLFWYDYDHGRQTVVVPPFFTRTDRDAHTATAALLPVFFWHKEPGSAFFISLPGIVHTATEDHKNTIVAPALYWWSRSNDHSAGFFGPWWWWKSRRTGDDSYFRALVPLYFQRHRGDHDTIVTPLFLRKVDSTSAAFGMLPGIGFATKTDPQTHALIGWNVLLGPVYVRKGPKAADVIVPPFFFHTHTERAARTALIPLFAYSREGNAWRVLSLLGGGGSDPDLHGSWWWALNTFHVQRGDENATAVLPLFWLKKSPRATTVATPLFRHHEDLVEHESSTLAPLFFRHTSPHRDTWVAFPLAFWDEDKDAGVGLGGALPLALWMRSKDRSWTAVLPLLSYREHRGNDHVYVHGLYVDVQVDGRRSLGVLPLFRYHREDGYQSFASLPFIWWIKRDGYSRAFVGLGYWNQETGTRVFPGYFRWQVHDEQHKVIRSTEVGLPLYVHYRTPAKDVVVVAPWYRVKRTDGSQVVGVAPFWYATKKPGERSWSVLGDLVAWEREGDYSRMTFFWGFHTKPKLVKKKNSEARHATRKVASERLLEPGC